MLIETYSEKYYAEVLEIIELFHKEALSEYDGLIDQNVIIETITGLKSEHSKNAFLLIIDDKCVGLIAGMEIKSLFNNKRIYQELIWFVKEEFRSHGVRLFKKVEEILKERGIDLVIMAVMENSKTEKIKSLYERMGYKAMEVHFVKAL